MKRKINREGQTVIETALLLILILILFFGIAEIARAWWYKSQLSNAARVGARVAVVTTPLNLATASCSSSDPVVVAACAAITSGDLKSSAQVEIASSGTTVPVSGDSITVIVRGTFSTVFPGLEAALPDAGKLIPGGQTGMLLQTQMVMRHE